MNAIGKPGQSKGLTLDDLSFKGAPLSCADETLQRRSLFSFATSVACMIAFHRFRENRGCFERSRRSVDEQSERSPTDVLLVRTL